MSKDKIDTKYITLSLLTSMALCHHAYAMPGGAGCISTLISVTVLTDPLDFATIDVCAGTPGTLDVNANNGALTTTGCINGTSGAVQRAQVRVAGNQASSSDKVVLRLPSTPINITSAGNTMTVTPFDWEGKGADITRTINGNRTTTLFIGAILNVGAGQAGGSYSGTASVTATCL